MAQIFMIAGGIAAGAFLWTFMEYVLHRFAFHEARGKNYGSREHLRHHGSEDSILESWYLSWAGILLVGFALIPFLGRLAGQGRLGWAVGTGYVLGYGFYDLIHWRAHRRPIPDNLFGRYEASVRRHHFTHHFHAPLQNQGVTTPLWDWVFGTWVKVDTVKVPRRMAMRWLVDENGDVRPEYADTYAVRGSIPLTEGQQRIDREVAFANEVPSA